jgi:ABC-2 type transport system ATP-binding protein
MTVIISSHILPEIEMTCDRVLIINQGRVVAQGTPAHLRREIFGHSTYKLEVSGSIDALSTEIVAIDSSLRVTDQSEPDGEGFRHITLTTSRDDDLGESLLRTLLARDLRVRALSRTHPTLEDVFLAATRRSWDAVATAGFGKPETGDRKPETREGDQGKGSATHDKAVSVKPATEARVDEGPVNKP